MQPDQPMFDAKAWQLTSQQQELTARARHIGQTKFAGRAADYDARAAFPTENYNDLFDANLMGICIPKEDGGEGASFLTYALTAAEIGRYCGATALTWNMHVCSTLWSGLLTDDLEMDDSTRTMHKQNRSVHYQRILTEGAIYSQPFSEGSSAAAGATAFATIAHKVEGGWRVNGKKIFASLAGHANYYGILCTQTTDENTELSRRNTIYLAVPAASQGVTVQGKWDPVGMRGTVSRTLIFEDVFVPENATLMQAGIYFQAAKRWPHMFMTLTPSYMGIAQAAYDFTVKYLRGEIEGTGPVKRRQFATKQIAVAQMRIMLEQTKTLWFQSMSEACANPSKDQLMRAWAGQYTTMENANEIAQLAIRTCGGQSMLKTLPLERWYRDSRCGSLMLPWTAELCLDMLGKGCLYERGETDD